MGTKNKPGAYDCYAKAEPDEPMFVLLGRDPLAGAVVALWAACAKLQGADEAKVMEAVGCADAMEAWALSKGKDPSALRGYLEEIVEALLKREQEGQQAPAMSDTKASVWHRCVRKLCDYVWEGIAGNFCPRCGEPHTADARLSRRLEVVREIEDVQTMTATLTSTQARCTELIQELRAYRAEEKVCKQCVAIMAADDQRHFRGCPHLEELPEAVPLPFQAALSEDANIAFDQAREFEREVEREDYDPDDARTQVLPDGTVLVD